MTKVALEDLADSDAELPVTIELTIRDELTDEMKANLAKLDKLGILNGDTFLALLGQAPIDPINLMGTLMHRHPGGWVFASVFSMMRVLARNSKKAVSAALRVDLMGTSISGLALTRDNRLTIFKNLEIEPGPDTLNKIQALCDETIAASVRETKP